MTKLRASAENSTSRRRSRERLARRDEEVRRARPSSAKTMPDGKKKFRRPSSTSARSTVRDRASATTRREDELDDDRRARRRRSKTELDAADAASPGRQSASHALGDGSLGQITADEVAGRKSISTITSRQAQAARKALRRARRQLWQMECCRDADHRRLRPAAQDRPDLAAEADDQQQLQRRGPLRPLHDLPSGIDKTAPGSAVEPAYRAVDTDDAHR